jgi:hypothetical protein
MYYKGVPEELRRFAFYRFYGCNGSYGSDGALGVFLDYLPEILAEEEKRPGFFAAAFEDAYSVDEWPSRWLPELMRLEYNGSLRHLAFRLPKPPMDCGRVTYTAYRGIGNRDAPHGMSWTLCPRVDAFFAFERARTPRVQPAVLRARISPVHVLGYVGDRDEQELILCPASVLKIRPVEIDATKYLPSGIGSKPGKLVA